MFLRESGVLLEQVLCVALKERLHCLLCLEPFQCLHSCVPNPSRWEPCVLH